MWKQMASGIMDINLGCHRIPERCFTFRGKPMPFCSRCLGCSIGHIGSFFFFVFFQLPNVLILLLMIVPLGIDWGIQQWGGILSNNPRRLMTGILAGFGVGGLIWTGVSIIYNSFFSNGLPY